MAEKEWVSIGGGTVKKVTEKAILLVEMDNYEGDLWMPKSQISSETAKECDEGARIEDIVVGKWIAETKELI